MFIKLFLVFIFVPVMEIYVLLSVGSLIGLWPTIGLILATGIAGAQLARVQGISVLFSIQQELAQGRMPTSELIDAAMILAGGLLLLTPGFCTDLLGFLLLAPFSRKPLKQYLAKIFARAIKNGQIQINRY
ncbi:MAG: membrane protein FxsA [Deltaproteobacteria bacterium]|nr:membrane protein FxsA [Deltaproteobacteria bacterium]